MNVEVVEVERHRFRSRLAEEFDDLLEPPIGDVVDIAVRQGDRQRVRRRAGAAFLGCCVVALALAIGVIQTIPSGQGSAAADDPGPMEAATPRGVLALLTDAVSTVVPDTPTGGYAIAADGSLRVSMVLVRPTATGMIRVVVSDYAGEPGRPAGTYGSNVLGDGIRFPGDILVQVGADMADCTTTTNVRSYHPNGTLVEVDVATCTIDAGGNQMMARPALSTEEAIAVANDPRWGTRISKSHNDRGAQLPDVATFG